MSRKAANNPYPDAWPLSPCASDVLLPPRLYSSDSLSRALYSLSSAWATRRVDLVRQKLQQGEAREAYDIAASHHTVPPTRLQAPVRTTVPFGRPTITS